MATVGDPRSGLRSGVGGNQPTGYGGLIVPQSQIQPVSGLILPALPYGDGARIDGVSTDTISTPDSAAFDWTNGFDIRIDMAADNWFFAERVCHQYGGAGNQAFNCAIDVTGHLQIVNVSVGTATSTNAYPAASFIAGSRHWLRWLSVPDNGSGRWFTGMFWSDDGITWNTLDYGDTGATVAIPPSTDNINIGKGTSAVASKFTVYSMEIRNNVSAAGTATTGTLVANPNFVTDNRSGGGTIDNDSCGNAWTLSAGTFFTTSRPDNTGIVRIASDSLVTSDDTSRSGSFSKTTADSLVTSDATTRVNAPSRTATDSLVTSDAVSEVPILFRSVTDSLVTSDSVTHNKVFGTTTTDSLVTSDAIARAGAFSRTTTDSLVTSDAVTTVGAFPHTTTDSLVTSDAATRAFGAFGVIIHDASEYGGFRAAGGSTLTYAHTIGSGADRLLVVGVEIESSPVGIITATGVTYNGVAMTQAVVGDIPQAAEGSEQRVEIWYMLEANLPVAGTYNVVVTLSSAIAGTSGMFSGAMSLTGVNQSPPEATNSATNIVDGTTSSCSVTTLSPGAWAIDLVGSGSSVTFTPDSGQTKRFEQNGTAIGGNNQSLAMSTKLVPSPGSTTLGWTFSVSSSRQAQAIAVWAPSNPVGLFRVISDSLVTSDSATGTVVAGSVSLSRTASDNLVTSDVTTNANVFARTTTDSLVTSDAVTHTKVFGTTTTDSLVTSDAVIRLISISRAIADSLVTSDTTADNNVFARATIDSLVTSDVATRAYGGGSGGLIVLDSAGVVSAPVNGNGPMTWSHTIGTAGTGRLLVVVCGQEIAGITDPGSVPTVTFNGVAMTLSVDSGASMPPGQVGARAHIFHMLDADLPAAGTYTVSVTYSTVNPQRCWGRSVSMLGVAQTAPDLTTQWIGSGQASRQDSLAVVGTGGWVVDMMLNDDGLQTLTPDSGQVNSIGDFSTGTSFASSTKPESGSGTTTLGWSWPNVGPQGQAHVLAEWQAAGIPGLFRTITDSLVTSDSATGTVVSGSVSLSRSASDSLITSDATAGGVLSPRTTTDALVTSDAATIATPTFGRTTTDSLVASDVVTRVLGNLGVITLVQKQERVPFSTPPIGGFMSATFNTPPTQGNLLMFAVSSVVSGATQVGTLPSGWTILLNRDTFGNSPPTGGSRWTVIGYKFAGPSEPSTVDVGVILGSSPANADMIMFEWSGLVNSAPDASSSQVFHGTADVFSVALGPTGATSYELELAIAIAGIANRTGQSFDNGFTAQNSDSTRSMVGTKNLSVIGTTQTTAAWTNLASEYVGAIWVFRAAQIIGLLRTISDNLVTSDSATGVYAPGAVNLFRTASDSLITSDATAGGVLSPRTTTDALVTSDTVTKVSIVSRTATDSLVISDTTTRVANFSRTATDFLVTSDANTRVAVFSRTTTDSLVTSDAITIGSIVSRTATDSLVTSDATTRVATFSRTATDSIITSDAATIGNVFSRTTTDSLVISDAVTRTGVFSRTTTDSLVTSDSVGIGTKLFISITDSLITSDTATIGNVFFRTTTDSLITSDVISEIAVLFRNVSDSLITSDITTISSIVSRTTTDALVVSDIATISAIGFISRAVADSLVTSDDTTRIAIFSRTTTDSIVTSDTTTRTSTFSRTTSDSLITSDATTRVATFSRTTTDSLVVSDTISEIPLFTRTTTDSLAISDATTRVATFSRITTDFLVTSDTISEIARLFRDVSDSLVTSDATTKVSVVSRTVADSIVTSDATTRVASFARTTTDSLVTSDSASGVYVPATVNPVRTATDSLVISDVATVGALVSRTTTNTLVISDTITQRTLLARPITDSIITSDATTRVASFARTTTDFLVIGDTIAFFGGQPYVWNGTEWVLKPVKLWTGSFWLEKPMKVWTGSVWQLV